MLSALAPTAIASPRYGTEGVYPATSRGNENDNGVRADWPARGCVPVLTYCRMGQARMTSMGVFAQCGCPIGRKLGGECSAGAGGIRKLSAAGKDDCFSLAGRCLGVLPGCHVALIFPAPVAFEELFFLFSLLPLSPLLLTVSFGKYQIPPLPLTPPTVTQTKELPPSHSTI